ncbi:MAG: hypothetical protein PUB03_04085 [bacterium]|nr:hypothetical protein [bacterium]
MFRTYFDTFSLSTSLSTTSTALENEVENSQITTLATATSILARSVDVKAEKMNMAVSYIESLSDDELARLTTKLETKQTELEKEKTYTLK